ncbi:MAG: chemotaxis protein CheW [Bacillota bacterium]
MKIREKKEEVQEEVKQLVVFRLGDEEFGMDILKAKSIETLDQGITRVPKAPAFVEGVINLRGDIIPIVDLRKRFNLRSSDINPDTRIIIVEVTENDVGLMVDSVNEVIKVPVSSIEPAPAVTKGIDTVFLEGVAKVDTRLVVLLNLERTLTPEEVSSLEQL